MSLFYLGTCVGFGAGTLLTVAAYIIRDLRADARADRDTADAEQADVRGRYVAEMMADYGARAITATPAEHVIGAPPVLRSADYHDHEPWTLPEQLPDPGPTPIPWGERAVDWCQALPGRVALWSVNHAPMWALTGAAFLLAVFQAGPRHASEEEAEDRPDYSGGRHAADEVEPIPATETDRYNERVVRTSLSLGWRLPTGEYVTVPEFAGARRELAGVAS